MLKSNHVQDLFDQIFMLVRLNDAEQGKYKKKEKVGFSFYVLLWKVRFDATEEHTRAEYIYWVLSRVWRKKMTSQCHNVPVISTWAEANAQSGWRDCCRWVCLVPMRPHLQLEDFDAVPVVPQLLLQLGDGLLQRRDLLLPLLVLVQPVGDLVRAAEHVGALLLVQLWQRGHQPAHAVLHHLWDGGDFNEKGLLERPLTCRSFW